MCKTLLTTVQSDSSKSNYLNKLSRKGLAIPSIDLLQYISKLFAILDCISDTIRKSSLPKWKLAEYVLRERNDYPSSLLSRNHKHLLSKVNGVITDTYFNNEQKKLRDTVRKDNIKDFKQREHAYHNHVVKPF